MTVVAAGEKLGLPQTPSGAARQKRVKNGKSAEKSGSHQASIRCPECASQRVWKDGLRKTGNGEVQRWLCRSCGFRFSESTANNQVKVDVFGQHLKQSDARQGLLQSDVFQGEFSVEPSFENFPLKRCEDIGSHISSKQTITEKTIYAFSDYNRDRRVCVSEAEAKNLAKVESRNEERATGATETTKAGMRGKIIKLAWWMKKQGYSEETVRLHVSALRTLLARGADLFNTDSVKELIAKQNWSDTRRRNVINAYTVFLKLNGLHWEKPKCKVVQKIPFIPSEQELDVLIAGSGRKISTFLQLLKETAMRAGEARKLKWTDIDFDRRIVTLNNPEKGSKPRIWKVTEKLIGMLKNLPRDNQNVFGNTTYDSLKQTLQLTRKRLANKLQNPRLLRITFHTFRHWKATMLYHQTKDPYYVKEFLGHRSIKNTEIYITIEHAIFSESSDDEFIVKVANNPEEIKTLLEAGFQYVCEKDGMLFFRKRK